MASYGSKKAEFVFDTFLQNEGVKQTEYNFKDLTNPQHTNVYSL